MVRQFTKDTGRFCAGEVKDYPKTTWKGLERTAGPMNEWSTTVIGDHSTPAEKKKVRKAKAKAKATRKRKVAGKLYPY